MLFSSDGRVNIQVMADKVKINSKGLASVPGKYVDIVLEEFN